MAQNILGQIYNSKKKVKHLKNICIFHSKVDMQSYHHLCGEAIVKILVGPLASFALDCHKWMETFRAENFILCPAVILTPKMYLKS